ncbi:MAG: GreA/GreB family elongation factor [Verrucomicrobia bacterium]|nr:GreA/GreB family elongation factor [Verrucomicrobiota bacterium]
MDMGYLVDFEKAIANHDAPAILRLWEEYTSSDEVDGEDFRAILEAVKKSDLRDYIGRHIERSLPLWEKVKNEELADDILRLIVDLQTLNNDLLRQLTMTHIEKRFGNDKYFNEKMRLIGLRAEKGDFKGAIGHFLLLNHMHKGNFVFHTLGWGVGEIMDVSMLREQVSLEFDYAPGRKEMSFKIAFTTLIPIPKTHFLAERFGNPDALEEKAKQNPVELIRKLLKDLGPKTAAEIKDELCELVIPESEWNRWWQTARTKIKKDTRIESPSDIKMPFRLLKEEISHEERFKAELEKKPDAETLIQMVYSFLKDFSDTLKNEAFKESLLTKMKELISFKEITAAQELQIHFFLQDLSGEKDYQAIPELLKKIESVEKLVDEISIQSFKKRTLTQVRKYNVNWEPIFLNLLFTVDQGPLRDYILSELLKSGKEAEVKKRLDDLCQNPHHHPEMIIWYFQKCLEDSSLPHGTAQGKATVFEGFLVALSYLEQKGQQRDLIKKMHGILSANRYAVVREIMKLATVTDVQEFLLLISKCHSLSDHDIKIFHSLAEVAYPSLAKKKKKGKTEEEEEIIWTTAEGYSLLQKKIEQIGTVETVENAKEIEIARAHGDLRENAEFKAALERRDRLQAELKFLSDQLNKSRILSKEDFDEKKVGVGAIVDCKSETGELISYTILGPWDADPDKHILSFQSKLAKSMSDLTKGDSFEIQGKNYTILDIRSAL